jgi:hypothetical protein
MSRGGQRVPAWPEGSTKSGIDLFPELDTEFPPQLLNLPIGCLICRWCAPRIVWT